MYNVNRGMNVKAYDDLIDRYADIVRLGQVGSILMWDQNTYMPPGAVEMRGSQQSLVSGIAHKKLTSPRIRKLIKKIENEELTDKQRAIVREIDRVHTKASSIPRKLVEEISRMEPVATGAWIKAREKSDFSLFKKEQERFFSLKKEVAEHVGYEDSPYDALIDEYEPYMKSRKIEEIFHNLGRKLKPLVGKLTEACREMDPDAIKGDYPVEKQKSFSQFILQKMGYDMERGRMDISAHPFTSGSMDDVRITLRFDENDIRPGLFSTIHEGGHALYEQGFRRENYLTPLSESVSLGIHESQSRFWENIIGRSRIFWEYMYPELKSFLPTLEQIDLDLFFKAINHVVLSPVRVEADEVTYSMHILVRFLIEKDLIEEKLDIPDVPQAWNDLYERYLGIVPENDSEGCLQDIHWAMGAIGYFPTYTLGNLYSAQFYNEVRHDVEDIDTSIGNGDLVPALKWLRENIHVHGKFYSADDLVREVTGHPLTEDHFINYLKDKYSQIFDVDI
jgi:carboxypeptidase Taq